MKKKLINLEASKHRQFVVNYKVVQDFFSVVSDIKIARIKKNNT